MLKRIVKMEFDPARVPEFLDNFRRNRAHIQAFPGCRHLELLRDTEHAHVFFTFSVWDDAAALEAYRRSELFRRVWAATKPLFAARPLAWSVTEVAPQADG